MRILLVLACGPGSDGTYDTVDIEVDRTKGGGSGKPVSAQLQRSVWGACAEAALESARTVFELQPRGAQLAVLLVGDGEPGGKVDKANGWGEKGQSLSTVAAGLERVRCSGTPIDTAKVGEAAGHMAVDAHASRGTGGEGVGGGCRIVFVCTPESLSGGEPLSCAEAVAAKVEQASAGVAGAEISLEFLWVMPAGSAPAVSGPEQAVDPSLVKSALSRIVARHLRLQCVRITGIPMKVACAQSHPPTPRKGGGTCLRRTARITPYHPLLCRVRAHVQPCCGPSPLRQRQAAPRA
jgi:hypothetical protein